MQEKRVHVNQVALQIQAYEHVGDAIICLHFSGANLMMWQPAVPYFRERYRLILVDLRGHGRSATPATGYHMDDMARDIVAIMDHLGLERAHIIGSSLGAEVGLSLAANYPAKVISLVCDGALSSEFGPYGTWEGTEDAFEEHVARQLEKIRSTPAARFPTIDALIAERRTLFEKYVGWNEAIAAMERYGARRLDDGQFSRGVESQAMEAYMGHYFHYRLEDYYRRVQCPLLMVAEEHIEDERETAVMHALCDLAPHAQIAKVPAWNHPYGWLLDPENVCRTVLRFLAHPAH